MRRSFALFFLISFPLLAAERGYQFRLTRDPHGVKLTEGQGTHWKWVMIGCPPSKPDCEYVVNDHSGGGRGLKGYDLGIVLKDEKTVQMRCLHVACSVTYSIDDSKPMKKQLALEQTMLIPMNAHVAVVFEDK